MINLKHITPVLKDLHWLPISDCITYKSCICIVLYCNFNFIAKITGRYNRNEEEEEKQSRRIEREQISEFGCLEVWNSSPVKIEIE